MSDAKRHHLEAPQIAWMLFIFAIGLNVGIWIGRG